MPIKRQLLRQLFRLPGTRLLANKIPLVSIETQVFLALGPRPMYSFGVYSAAELAKALGLAGISVIEFGVAGGRGLLALERAAEKVARHFRIAIDVFGFDTGTGMPPPADYRDIPYAWGAGFYRMDAEQLRKKLKQAQLVIGDVERTIPAFLAQIRNPIGFVSFDLDYHSSTCKAFRLWDAPPESRLPRVMCYFDDILAYNEYLGELCAIRDFNLEHQNLKLCPMHLLRHTQAHPSPWHDQIYMLHDFHHPLYAVNVRSRIDPSSTQLPL